MKQFILTDASRSLYFFAQKVHFLLSFAVRREIRAPSIILMHKFWTSYYVIFCQTTAVILLYQ